MQLISYLLAPMCAVLKFDVLLNKIEIRNLLHQKSSKFYFQMAFQALGFINILCLVLERGSVTIHLTFERVVFTSLYIPH